MKKTEFFEMYEIQDRFETFVYDRWVDWTLKQNNITTNEGYNKVLESIPTCCCYYVSIQKGTIAIEWNGDESTNIGQQITLPLTIFYDDEDEQPDLKILWHTDFYDHPLKGMALYNGEKVWFRVKIDNKLSEDVYEILQLTPELIKKLEQRHKTFQEMVGYHYDHDPKIFKPFNRDNSKIDEFYATKREKVDLSECPVIATVKWFQFKHWN